MHQSVVEVGTNICECKRGRKEIKFLRTKIVELADKQGLIVGGAGTSFSKWQDQPSLTIHGIITL
jgi:carboxylate-amine ligase